MGSEDEKKSKPKKKGERESKPPPLEPRQGVYGSGGSYGMGGGFEEGGSTLEEPPSHLPVEHKGPVPTND